MIEKDSRARAEILMTSGFLPEKKLQDWIPVVEAPLYWEDSSPKHRATSQSDTDGRTAQEEAVLSQPELEEENSRLRKELRSARAELCKLEALRADFLNLSESLLAGPERLKRLPV